MLAVVTKSLRPVTRETSAIVRDKGARPVIVTGVEPRRGAWESAHSSASPSAAAPSPAHSSGSVIASGSTVVSQSISDSASSTATTPHHSSATGCAPKRQATAAKSSAVPISTAGYRSGIGVLHAEHRPRSSSQLSTGMFSYQRMRWPQLGQREAGRARPRGARPSIDFASALPVWPMAAGAAAAKTRR